MFRIDIKGRVQMKKYSQWENNDYQPLQSRGKKEENYRKAVEVIPGKEEKEQQE